MKNKKRTIKTIVGVFLSVAAIAVAALVFAVAVFSKINNRPAYFFNHSFMYVETGSMSPVIKEKSYVLMKKYDGKPLSEGDVIAYRMTDTSSPLYGELIVHRVYKVTETEGVYVTKGDANSAPDEKTVSAENIEAVYVCNLPVLTFIGKLYTSPLGLVAIIALFAFVFAFVYVPDIIAVFKEDSANNSEQKKQAIIDRRVREEVQKMLQSDRKKTKKRSSGAGKSGSKAKKQSKEGKKTDGKKAKDLYSDRRKKEKNEAAPQNSDVNGSKRESNVEKQVKDE